MEALIVCEDRVQCQLWLSLHMVVEETLDQATTDSAQEDGVIGETQSYVADLEFHSNTQKRLDNAEEHVVVVVVVVVVVDCLHHLWLRFVCHDTFDRETSMNQFPCR